MATLFTDKPVAVNVLERHHQSSDRSVAPGAHLRTAARPQLRVHIMWSTLRADGVYPQNAIFRVDSPSLMMRIFLALVDRICP